jgi:hypothetical protein
MWGAFKWPHLDVTLALKNKLTKSSLTSHQGSACQPSGFSRKHRCFAALSQTIAVHSNQMHGDGGQIQLILFYFQTTEVH